MDQLQALWLTELLLCQVNLPNQWQLSIIRHGVITVLQAGKGFKSNIEIRDTLHFKAMSSMPLALSSPTVDPPALKKLNAREELRPTFDMLLDMLLDMFRDCDRDNDRDIDRLLALDIERDWLREALRWPQMRCDDATWCHLSNLHKGWSLQKSTGKRPIRRRQDHNTNTAQLAYPRVVYHSLTLLSFKIVHQCSFINDTEWFHET